MRGANGKRRTVLLPVMCAMLMFASLAQPASTQGIYIRGIDPWRGAPGMTVRVYGGGATSNGAVIALLDGALGDIALGSAVADSEGYWEIIFTVPEVPPGYYTVLVVDSETSTSSEPYGFEVFEVQIEISYPSPSAGPPGTFVYLKGYGAFPGGEVRVYFDGTSVANTMVDEWGNWYLATPFQVPDVTPGNYTIIALDVESNTTDTAMFTVTPPPTIQVSPREGPIGSKITVSGENFMPRSATYLMFEDILVFNPISIDENGKFNTTLLVPVVNSGNYTVSALGGYMLRVANASFRVTVGLDTLFDRMNDVQIALNQTRTTAQSALVEATAAKEGAARAEVIAGEARTYALVAMIFAIIAAASSLATLLRKRA